VTSKTDFQWTSSARTDTGLVRQKNEDAFLERPQRGVWAVADGMGGHALGELASRMIVESLDQLAPQDSVEKMRSAARERLQAVNRQLRAEAETRGLQVIGSTVVVLLAHGSACSYLWAGDSRLYLYRGGQLTALTRDHSQIEELRALGGQIDAALLQPARNLITRAVGAWDTIELDDGSLDVEDGDVFLLCSDGLSNEVDEQQLCAVLARGDCEQAAAMLVDLALQGGGRDNISAVVIRADAGSDTGKPH